MGNRGGFVRVRRSAAGQVGRRSSAAFALAAAVVVLGFVLLVVYGAHHPGAPSGQPTAGSGRSAEGSPGIAAVRAAAGRPFHFEPNLGQWRPGVRYAAKGPGFVLALNAEGAVLAVDASPPAGKPGAAVVASAARPLYEAGSRLGARVAGDADAAVVDGAAVADDSEPGRSVLRMRLLGADSSAELVGERPLPGRSHYLVGDRARWRSDVPRYAEVRYREPYSGIDLVFHAQRGRLEYDFVVAPGADPYVIELGFEGAQDMYVNGDGRLLLDFGGADFVQAPPLVYQGPFAQRREVEGRWEARGPQRFGFAVGDYDAAEPLVIDPVLEFSTFLGGSSADRGHAVAVDGAGNVYVTGQTGSTDFPTEGGFQKTFGGGFQDIHVSKFDASGNVVFSTYLGGTGNDVGNGITVRASGIYVAGETRSTDFPTFAALQKQFGGGVNDAYLLKLHPSGSSLVFSTYLGGAGNEVADAVATEPLFGDPVVAGGTTSTNFPTLGAAQKTNGGGDDAFFTALTSNGSSLLLSSYLGGSGTDQAHGVAADAFGSVYLAGRTDSTNFPTTTGAFQTSKAGDVDAFVSKTTSSGDALAYSTYLGGSGIEIPHGFTLDGASVYITGVTRSTNFPTTPGAFQGTNPGATFPPSGAFVTAVNASGSGLELSTYLGGSFSQEGIGIDLDADGFVYVTGKTASTDFPTADAVQGAYGGGSADAFVTKLEPDGTGIVYSTYLGGAFADNSFGGDVAVGPRREAYVVGSTNSSDFPVVRATQPTFQGVEEVFVAKLTTPSLDFFIGAYRPPGPRPRQGVAPDD